MTRDEVLLAILAAAEGREYTPVQIQKAAFLVNENVPSIFDAGEAFSFEPYDYGPFDQSVYRAATLLQCRGLVTIEPSSYGRWSTYAATEIGIEAGRRNLDRLSAEGRRYIEDVSRWVRSQTFAGLVRSIYEAYPAMKANSIFRG